MDFQQIEIEELAKGYRQEQQAFICVFCATQYALDEIFPHEGKLLTAEGRMKAHIQQAHQSPFHAMLALDKKTTGLTDVQIDMMARFYDELSDQQIVEATSVGSVSTVRQHRFKLREKERQAKLFLALMQCMKEPTKYKVHKGAKQVDERYGIEEKEREKVLQTYFKDGLDGQMTNIPSKEKKKLIILQHIVQRFNKGQAYTEREVNDILKTAHADFVSLRRHLIEYGFMVRSADGSQYEVKA